MVLAMARLVTASWAPWILEPPGIGFQSKSETQGADLGFVTGEALLFHGRATPVKVK